MKKELIVIIFVIILIIILEIVTNNYTDKCIKDVSDNLMSLKEIIQNNPQDNKEKIEHKIEEVNENWDEHFKVLAYYIEHNELEKINTELTLLKSYSEIEDYKSAIPVVDKCNFILKHINEKQKFTIQSIF